VLALLVLAALPAFDAEQRAALERGEVLIEKLEPTGGDGVSARVVGVVSAPPERVFPIVDDCSRFHEFMPRTKRSEERYRTERTSKCYVEISMPFPLKDLWAETLVTREPPSEGVWRREWKLHKGSYRRNSGSWTLYPWGEGGRKTLAVYVMDAAPNVPIPDALARAAQSSSLPDLYEAIRARAARPAK